MSSFILHIANHLFALWLTYWLRQLANYDLDILANLIFLKTAITLMLSWAIGLVV
jgi:hypothetical protein